MAELRFSTIRKRNEALLQQKSAQLNKTIQILASLLKDSQITKDVINTNHKTIEADRNRPLVSENIEKISLLISKKGKILGKNMVRTGYLSKSEALQFVQEKRNKRYETPSFFTIEAQVSKEDYKETRDNAEQPNKKSRLAWEDKQLASMTHRILFKRVTPNTITDPNIAFYFKDIEECIKMANFLKAINILEKNKVENKDSFGSILTRLSLKHRAQMARKFRVALHARSVELDRQKPETQQRLQKLLTDSKMLSCIDALLVERLVGRWETELIIKQKTPITLAVSEIFCQIKENTEPLAKSLKHYGDNILEIAVTEKKDDNASELKAVEGREAQMSEEFASTFLLNYHLYCVEQVESENQKKDVLMNASKLIKNYGKKLKPHPIYQTSKMTVSQEMKKKDDEIINKIQTDPELKEKSIFINVLKQATREAGTEILFTDKQTLNEVDSLQLLATGEFTHPIVKVIYEELDESNYHQMAVDMNYANQIYKEFKQAFIGSKIYEIEEESEANIVAVECNPKVTAVLYAPNSIQNEKSKHVKVPGFSFSIEPAIKYLSLDVEFFDSEGDMEWSQGHIECDQRGGLDYYFPRGWKGCGLKVLDKYADGNIWLNDWENGWAVAYHGVGADPDDKIPKILSSELLAGVRQLCKDYEDINELKPTQRKVGKGIYFGRKIGICESLYSKQFEVDGKNYKVILQCRLEPKEIRIPEPKDYHDYFVVPKGAHARPYRILIKEV